MSITATELKVNLGKYLMLAETEDIYITRNGKDYAKSPVKVCEPCMFLKLLEKGNKES